jgi:hypothetical protein
VSLENYGHLSVLRKKISKRLTAEPPQICILFEEKSFIDKLRMKLSGLVAGG